LELLYLFLQSKVLLQLLHDDNPADSYYDTQQVLNASSEWAVSTDENFWKLFFHNERICRSNSSAQGAIKRPLPCVDQDRDATLNDPGLTEISKNSSTTTVFRRQANLWEMKYVDLHIESLDNDLATTGQAFEMSILLKAVTLVLLTNGISHNVQEWLVYHLLMSVKKNPNS
jgi:hypothetical protein